MVEGCEIYVGVEAISGEYSKEAWIQIEDPYITRTGDVKDDGDACCEHKGDNPKRL